jgi:hypothetical protein
VLLGLAGQQESSLQQWQNAVEEEGHRAMALATELSFTMESWVWAWAVAMSRSFCLVRDANRGRSGVVRLFHRVRTSATNTHLVPHETMFCQDHDKSSLAIVPLLDMINHDDKTLCPLIWTDPTGALRCLARYIQSLTSLTA